MFKENRGKKLAIIAVVIIALALVALIYGTSSGQRDSLSMPENFLKSVLAPIRNGAGIIQEKVLAVPDYFRGVDELRDENEELKNEISQLQMTITALTEAREENKRLLELLGAKNALESEWETSASRVIGRAPNFWYNTITIKGGTDRGYEANMPVVNANGLVGRITSVSSNSSEVVLLTDQQGAVGAMLQDSRTVGVVQANDFNSGLLEMIHIPYDEEIENNQIVISSGLGGIYPKGLFIGYVVDHKTEPGGLMISASIQPFVDFDRLEEVLVLTMKKPASDTTPTPEVGGDVSE